MLDYNDLLISIKKAAMDAVHAEKQTGVVFGAVVSVEPLGIRIDQKLTLTAAQLVLTRNVTDHSTKISFDAPVLQGVTIGEALANTSATLVENPATGEELSRPVYVSGGLRFTEKVEQDVTIYNGLSAGDKVVMMQMQGGQKFIVLDRVMP